MALPEVTRFTVSVGVRGRGDGLESIKKVIALGDDHTTYMRRLGIGGHRLNTVCVSQTNDGILFVTYDTALHQLSFPDSHRTPGKTYEESKGVQRVLPGEIVEINLKPGVRPTTNGDRALYIVHDQSYSTPKRKPVAKKK